MPRSSSSSPSPSRQTASPPSPPPPHSARSYLSLSLLPCACDDDALRVEWMRRTLHEHPAHSPYCPQDRLRPALELIPARCSPLAQASPSEAGLSGLCCPASQPETRHCLALGALGPVNSKSLEPGGLQPFPRFSPYQRTPERPRG